MKLKTILLTVVMLFIAMAFTTETYSQAGKKGMIRFYKDYVKSDLQSATHGGLTNFQISGNATVGTNASVGGTLDVTGASTVSTVTIEELYTLELHTVVAGDSALGRVFLDAADTTIKAGTGSDLVVIKDLAP